MIATGRTFGAHARLERVVAAIARAINTRALYGPAHPELTLTIGEVLETLKVACSDRRLDSVTFLRFGDELAVDERPLRKGAFHHQPVIRALKRLGIERLTLALGLDAAEARELVEALVLGRVPDNSAHVVLGQLQVAVPEAEGEWEGLPAGPGPGLTAADVEAATDAFLRLRSDRRGALDRFDGLVWSLMDQLSRSTGSLIRLAPLKQHDEYTFVHSVNVSLLVLAQARSFGLQGGLLHAIGLAALLHDVGKLRVPLEVLNKPGRLDGEEWKTMRMHTELGAWHLVEVESASPLAILVAYEHHLRFDARPSYPELRSPRRPVLASQLTAVADVYDAICTARPYRKALSRYAALEVLRARAGTFHDPFLLGNFFSLLGVE